MTPKIPYYIMYLLHLCWTILNCHMRLG